MPGTAAQQLDRLHRNDDQWEDAAGEREVTGVGANRLDRQADGAALELRQKLGTVVERHDRMAGASECQRDAAGAGSDVKDRPTIELNLSRELQPKRKVLDVATAFDVMPDRLAHAAVSQYGETAPRETSSSWSASSAV